MANQIVQKKTILTTKNKFVYVQQYFMTVKYMTYSKIYMLIDYAYK